MCCSFSPIFPLILSYLVHSQFQSSSIVLIRLFFVDVFLGKKSFLGGIKILKSVLIKFIDFSAIYIIGKQGMYQRIYDHQYQIFPQGFIAFAVKDSIWRPTAKLTGILFYRCLAIANGICLVRFTSVTLVLTHLNMKQKKCFQSMVA